MICPPAPVRFFTFSKIVSACSTAFALAAAAHATAESWTPEILKESVQQKTYLPDFSYVGYRWGEKPLPQLAATLNVADFGAKANDDQDDTEAVLKAFAAASASSGPVVLKFPQGRFIISSILYIERSQFVLQGSGSGPDGTVLYFPKPLNTLPTPPELKELEEYIVFTGSRQREPVRGIDAPFSLYAWSGGFIWTRVPGERPKPYLKQYTKPQVVLTKIKSGKRGQHAIEVESADQLRVGQLVALNWYNKDGERSSLIQHLYDNQPVQVGIRHWDRPDEPLIKQQVTIERIEGKTVFIKQPLLHDLRPEWFSEIADWKHIEEVGVEQLRIEFAYDEYYEHHLEKGFNAIYLTSTAHSWVRDVVIKGSDSGIISDACANVTVQDVTVYGRKAHYSIQFGDCYAMLGKHLYVQNEAYHSLSFNTGARGCVYTDCVVTRAPSLDQHSGANHQNLYDQLRLIEDDPERSFIYAGGAGYWAPTHGAFSTFWNVDVQFAFENSTGKPVKIQGVNNGASARLVGITANYPMEIAFEINPYREGINRRGIAVPSLYRYQLEKRLAAKKQ